MTQSECNIFFFSYSSNTEILSIETFIAPLLAFVTMPTTKIQSPSLQATADHRIEMAEAPIEEPGEGELLLRIKTTGIRRSVTSTVGDSRRIYAS